MTDTIWTGHSPSPGNLLTTRNRCNRRLLRYRQPRRRTSVTRNRLPEVPVNLGPASVRTKNFRSRQRLQWCRATPPHRTMPLHKKVSGSRWCPRMRRLRRRSTRYLASSGMPDRSRRERCTISLKSNSRHRARRALKRSLERTTFAVGPSWERWWSTGGQSLMSGTSVMWWSVRLACCSCRSRLTQRVLSP